MDIMKQVLEQEFEIQLSVDWGVVFTRLSCAGIPCEIKVMFMGAGAHCSLVYICMNVYVYVFTRQ